MKREIGIIKILRNKTKEGHIILKYFNSVNSNFHELDNSLRIESITTKVKYKIPTFLEKRIDLEEILKEGNLVIFELCVDESGRDQIGNISLVTTQDIEILKPLAESNDKSLWKPIFNRYIKEIPVEEAISLIIYKINSISPDERLEFLKLIPLQILVQNNARPIRNFLPFRQHLDLCFKIFDQLSKLDKSLKIDPNFILEILFTFSSLSNNSQEVYVDKVFDIVESQIKEDADSHLQNEYYIKHIANILARTTNYKRYLLAKFKPWVKENELIFKLLSPIEQIGILSDRLTKQELLDKEETIQLIAKIIETSSPNQRPDLVARLPHSVKLNPAIVPFLSDNEKIKYAYILLKLGSASFWQKLSPESKILCCYLILKKNKNFSTIVDTLLKFNSTEKETHILVRCVLKLLWAKANPSRTQEVFLKVHELILEYVITKANSTTEFLTLYSLLPRCRPRIANYCEGKPWKQEKGKPLQEQNYARCLRAKRKCHLSGKNPQADDKLNTGNNFLLEGARIYANCSQHWKNWSLLELFEATGVLPQLPGLKHPEEYVPKLSAWVNRINEIRERLKCSVCNQLMPHNVKYSKFSTKFRVTVFDCQQGDNHDQGVYLNECWGWGCHQIIDNRESKFKQERYYICIHCGSGPLNSNTYTPGDICPKCGSKEGMEKSESNSRERKCPSCNHSILLPYQVKITDSKVDNNSDRGWEDIEF